MALPSQSKANAASNLIRVSAVLYLVYYYLNGGKSSSFNVALATCIALGILLLLGLFIRQGHKWAKWVLLLLLISTITPDAINLPSTFKANVYAGCIAIIIDLLQIGSLVLLFMPDKSGSVTDDAE
jgi:multisubunit Na+/H+ antiporter MnhE subunit